MRKTITCLSMLLLLAASRPLYGQADSSRLLQEVFINGTRFDQFNTGTKTDQVDSVSMIAMRSDNMADLLALQSQVYIKSYALGSLASPSFRGAGADHTAVLWNGFNLQSPMYGQFDFSLMPVEFTDAIIVQYGGNGSLFGSGAVGGSIQLNSSAQYGSGLHAKASGSTGSYSSYRQSLALGYGSRKWYTSFRAINRDAKNDFTFRNSSLPGTPEVKQSNAALAQRGFMNEHYFQTGKDQELSARVWYQYTLREIPPTLSMASSVAQQLDEAWRFSAEWKKQRKNTAWFIRSAWFDEIVFYDDSVSAITGRNKSKTSITEAECRIRLSPRHALNIGLNNTYIMGYSRDYSGWVDQNRFAVFASYRYTSLSRKLTTTASIRQEFIYQAAAPVIPSLGFEWKPLAGIRVFGNVAASYRVPTLNERYWRPGGNPDLKPEYGWGEELSVSANRSSGNLGGVITVTAFNRNVQDWIIWQPEGSYWSPRNLNNVWSRGLEGSFRLGYRVGKYDLLWQSKVNYVVSTNENSSLAADASIGKQLIYVPRVTQQHQLTCRYKKAYITYWHNYTGLRFYATDNSQWLNDFQTGTLQLGYGFSIARTYTLLGAEVNNLWNKTYLLIAERPMPGRNYMITITIHI